MRRLKLTLKAMLWTLVAVMLLLAMGITWLCYTQAGLQWALDQLNHLPRMQVSVTGVQGRLAGPLHIDHLVLDHERVRIEVSSLDMSLTPALMMSGLIAVDQLRMGKAVVTYKPLTHVTPDLPIHFLPPFLRAHVDQLEIGQGQYRHSNGYVLNVTRFNAAVAMTRHRLRLETFDARTTDFDIDGMATLRATQVLTLMVQGKALYRVPNGVQLKGEVHAQGPVTGEMRYLDLTAQLHQPHELQAVGKLTFPDGNWLVAGDAQARTVLLDAWWQQPAFHLTDTRMHFTLNAQGMRYVGEARVPEWSPAMLHLDADTVYAKKVFTLRRAEVSVPATGVVSTSRGTISMTTGKPVLDIQGSWRALRWPLEANTNSAVMHSPQGNLTLSGGGPYAWNLDAEVMHQQWPGGKLQAQGTLHTASTPNAGSELRVARFILNSKQNQIKGQASGAGTLTLKRPYDFKFNLNASGMDPSQWLADWPGHLNVVAEVKGRMFETRTQPQWLDARIQQLSGQLRQQVVQGAGHVQVSVHNRVQDWQADQIRLQWGSNSIKADGRLHTGKNTTQRLNVQVHAPKLDEWQLGISGDLEAKAEFGSQRGARRGTGNEYGDIALSLNATASRLSYQRAQITDLKAQATLSSDDTAPLSLQVSAQELAAGPFAWRALQVSGTGTAQEHEFTLDALPIADVLPEQVRLHLALKGGYRAPQWQGTLTTVQMVDAEQRPMLALQQPVALSWSPDNLTLGELCIHSSDNGQDGHGCVHGNAARDAHDRWNWSAQAMLDNLPLTLRSNKFAPGAKLVGRLFGSADFSAQDQQPWQGKAQAMLSQASIRYQVNGRNKTLPVREVNLLMNADPTALSAEAELRIGEQTVSTFSATLTRDSKPIMQWPLNGVMSLSSSDAQLIPVFFADVDRARGTMASILQVSGTAAAPQLNGQLKLLQGELDFYQINLALRQMTLNANLNADASGQHLDFTAQSATGVKGDQGQLKSDGEFAWRADDLNGTLHLQGDKLLVADLPEYHVFATPDLTFAIRNRTIDVSGEVLIPEARLQPKAVVGAVQKSVDARLINDETLPESQQWKVRSRVTVRMGDAVNFDGLGLQGKLAGAVTTHMQSGNVASGEGELFINDGRYEAYSQKLDIKRGRLIYNDTALDDPGLDIQAERAINDPSLGDITVGVYVRGVLHAPRLQFYSEPPMNQTQIVSYLLVGKPLDSLQGQEASSVRSASNTLALQGGGYLAGQLGRRIGLEEVGVETDSNNQSSLVLGKFLSPRLFVSYGISLTEAINTFKLRYILGKHWQIKTEAGEAKSADLEFKIEH